MRVYRTLGDVGMVTALQTIRVCFNWLSTNVSMRGIYPCDILPCRQSGYVSTGYRLMFLWGGIYPCDILPCRQSGYVSTGYRLMFLWGGIYPCDIQPCRQSGYVSTSCQLMFTNLILCLLFRKLSCWQKSNEQTPLKTSDALHYATVLCKHK